MTKPIGRPPGSRNRKVAIPPVLISKALTQLAIAVGAGEQWAIQETLKRVPTAMAEPVAGGIQEQLLQAKIEEANILRVELDQLKALVAELSK